MPRFRIQVQALQELIVEAKTAEEARMKVIDGKVDTILRNSCDDMGADAYVSDGVQIDESSEYAKRLKNR